MKKVAFIVIGIVLFIGGYGLGAANAPQNSYAALAPINNTPTELACPHSLTTHPLTSSSNKNGTTLPQNSTAHSAPDVFSKSNASAANIPSTVDTDEHNRLLQYFITNEQKKYNDYLKSLNTTPEKLHQTLIQDFNNEGVDASWASAQQGFLNNYISQNKTLSRLSNIEAECRSLRCKISVLDDNPELTTAIIQMSNESANRFSNYISTIDPVTHATNIYFDRNSVTP